MAMLVLIVIALPGTDADGTDLAALTTSRHKDHTGTMANLWPEPKSRQGRVLNTYTPLTDSNIMDAANLWVFNKTSAIATYGAVDKWNLSQVTSLQKVWCGYNELYCGQAYMLKQSFNDDISKWDVAKVTNMIDTFDYAENFNGDISKWDVAKVTDMLWSKSIRIFENDLT
jgi:surface protein